MKERKRRTLIGSISYALRFMCYARVSAFRLTGCVQLDSVCFFLNLCPLCL